MTNVLILSQPDDVHAIYVRLALEAKGHKATISYSGDFPENQTHALNYHQGMMDWYASGIFDDIRDVNIDTVWNRRLGNPILPEWLHQDDVENAKKEMMAFYGSLWQTIMQKAIWVNSPESKRKANYKSYQLKVAEEVGLRIPDTLMSNDPERIKAFINERNNQHVIYKSLMPLTWFEKDSITMLYTSCIKEEDLPADEVLQCVPGIFQEKVEKAYELRVIYFGYEYIAVKIDSQCHPDGKIDWRAVPPRELALERVFIPNEVDRKCQMHMWRLGIIFGCFDFIVTPDGEYVFLEVNEQGQFLWIERLNNKIPMLDSFARFLISKGEKSSSNESRSIISLRDFEHIDIERIVAVNRGIHKGSMMLRSA